MTANFNWNPIKWIPKDIEAPILAWTKNNKLMVFKNTKTCLNGDIEHPFSGFNNLVEKYNIKYWIYQDTIISNSNNLDIL